ncbi:hypothetical protein BD560DRAFT_450386, partial [Blakeslea trispora]
MHSSTNKSISSIDQSEEYIDLDRALIEDELRSLVSTPEHQHGQQFKISLKSIDECKTERFRRSLVTPLPKYNHSMNLQQSDWCATTNKSSNDSCAESVALFKNLSSNEDHIDFVSSDLKEFMSPYDMDDIVSRPNSRVPSSLYCHRNTLTSSRLRNHNMQKTPEPLVEQKPILRHTNNKGYTIPVSHNPASGVPESMNRATYLDETIAIPRKHSFDSIEELRKKPSPSTPLIAETSEVEHAELPNQTNNGRLQTILNKRRSIDSDALKKLKSQEYKVPTSHLSRSAINTKSKQLNTFTEKTTKPKHVPSSTAIPAPSTSSRRASLLRQPDSRRWSARISEQQIEEIKKSPLISPRQLPINTAKRNSSISHQNEASLLSKKKLANHDRLAPFSTRLKRIPLKSLSDGTKHLNCNDTKEDLNAPLTIQINDHNIKYDRNSSLIKNIPEEEVKVLKESTPRRLVRRDRPIQDHQALEASPTSPSVSKHVKRLSVLAAVNRQQNTTEPALLCRPNASNHRHSINSANHHDLLSAETEGAALSGHTERLTESNTYRRRVKPFALAVETSQASNTVINNDSSYHQLSSEDKLPTPLSSTSTARYRKYGNGPVRYAHVVEDASPLVDTPSKEVRFSKTNTFISHPNDVPIAASQSTGGLSNSTGSSHSGELYYDPPLSANSRNALLSQKRCSIPVLNTALIDEQVQKSERRYSSYLARIKHEDEPVADDFEYAEHTPIRYASHRRPRAVSTEESEVYAYRKTLGSSTLRRPSQRQDLSRDEYIPRRRVLSEDNKGVKGQGRDMRQYSISN